MNGFFSRCKNYAFLLLGVIGISLSISYQALANEMPDQLIKDISQQLLSQIRSDLSIKHNPNKLKALIEKTVLPTLDIARMTGLAVGREWRTFSADQKSVIAQEFKLFLIRTYSIALLQYIDDTIEVQPLSMNDNGKRANVKLKIFRSNEPDPVSLEFVLYLNKDGQWKVFDVIVAGISLVVSYRETFAAQLTQGGVTQLINFLRTKNANNAGA